MRNRAIFMQGHIIPEQKKTRITVALISRNILCCKRPDNVVPSLWLPVLYWRRFPPSVCIEFLLSHKRGRMTQFSPKDGDVLPYLRNVLKELKFTPLYTLSMERMPYDAEVHSIQ